MPRLVRPIAKVRSCHSLLVRSCAHSYIIVMGLPKPESGGLHLLVLNEWTGKYCTQGEIPELRQQITFIYCDDIAASEAFYRDKLGLPLVGIEDTPVRTLLRALLRDPSCPPRAYAQKLRIGI